MTPFHTTGDTCSGCELMLRGAHPTIADWFRNRVKIRHPDAHISCAFRNEAEQDADYEAGKSRKPWPESKHNHMDDLGDPCSMALDLFSLQSGLALYPDKFFKAIGNEVRADDSKIRCHIADWDMNHFEMAEDNA